MTGRPKSNHKVSNRIQMIVKAIGPVSRLYLAKEEDRKGIVTHILEECFAQFYLY